MKFAEKTDLALNILYIIMCIIVIVIVAICFSGGELFIGGAGDAANSMPTDGNDPGAGYVALGHLFAAGFAGHTGIVLFAMGLIYAIIGLILLVTIVSAFSRRKKYKLTGQSSFIKRNLLTKVVLNTICLVLMVILLFSAPEVLIGILVLVLVALEVLIIMAHSKI